MPGKGDVHIDGDRRRYLDSKALTAAADSGALASPNSWQTQPFGRPSPHESKLLFSADLSLVAIRTKSCFISFLAQRYPWSSRPSAQRNYSWTTGVKRGDTSQALSSWPHCAFPMKNQSASWEL